MNDRTWCAGSGVADDPFGFAGGHDVPVEWGDVAWLVNPGVTRIHVTKPRCVLCTQTRSDYLKALDRELTKAKNTLAAHADRYSKPKRWNCSVTEARRRLVAYGWDIQLIAQMFRDAIDSEICHECRWPWDYGEHEMTLDVSDPDVLPIISPDSRCNVSVMCRTCNTRKQRRTLAEWRQFQAYVRAAREGFSNQLSFEIPA